LRRGYLISSDAQRVQQASADAIQHGQRDELILALDLYECRAPPTGGKPDAGPRLRRLDRMGCTADGYEVTLRF
jgi:hypothetical protein